MNRFSLNKCWMLIPFFCFMTLSCDKDDEDVKEDSIAELQKNKEEGETFLKNLKGSEGVISDNRGLLFRINSKGDGLKPDANDTVQISYSGKLIDGKVFENEEKRVCMDELKEGLYIGLRYMSSGANHTLYLPYYLMYGSSNETFYLLDDTVTVKGFSVVIYEMQLKEVVKVN